MLGLKRLSSGDLGEPQAHSCLSLFALQKRRPPHRGPPTRAGLGRGQFPPSRGVGWEGSLTLGPGHSPLSSGSPVTSTLAPLVCLELVFLPTEENETKPQKQLERAQASDPDPRPGSASGCMALSLSTSSPVSGLSFLRGPEHGSPSLVGQRGRNLQSYLKTAWGPLLSPLKPWCRVGTGLPSLPRLLMTSETEMWHSWQVCFCSQASSGQTVSAGRQTGVGPQGNRHRESPRPCGRRRDTGDLRRWLARRAARRTWTPAQRWPVTRLL